MKKTLKTVISLVLAAALTFSLFSVGAFAQDKSIVWDYGEDVVKDTYYYGGELMLGENKVSPLADADEIEFDFVYTDLVYYEFEVEQSGYYNIVTDYNYYFCISQDIRDGVAYGDEEYISFTEDYDVYMCYLTEGDCVFGLCFALYNWDSNDEIYNSSLAIEFVGESITDMQIEEEYLEDIILGYHIASEYDEDNTSYLPVKGKVTFDSEKEVEISNYLKAEYDGNIAPGEAEIIFSLLNYKKDFTAQIKTVEDFVKSIEINNINEINKVKETFLPDYAVYPDAEDVELTITFADGTKKTETVDYGYEIELKGDKYIYIWCDYVQKEDGKHYFTVEVADKEYLSIPCETEPSSFDENMLLLWEGIMEHAFLMIDFVSMYLGYAFDLTTDVSIEDRLAAISSAFERVGRYFENVSEFVELFGNYYI